MLSAGNDSVVIHYADGIHCHLLAAIRADYMCVMMVMYCVQSFGSMEISTFKEWFCGLKNVDCY